MKIAFYAPLKPPDHPVPSGDRTMARLLIAALGLAGHDVEIASRLRGFRADPGTIPSPEIEAERDRIARLWDSHGAPDVWFCYHPYYKAPDHLGPALCRRYHVPMITAEASHAAKRDTGPWAMAQAAALEGIRQAAMNICFTARDHAGLARVAPPERLVVIPPFIDPAPFQASAQANPGRLICIAMMRPGDKMASYRFLAQALSAIDHLPWRLDVVGDGALRRDVHGLFDPVRVAWLGEKAAGEVPAVLGAGGIYVWPGCGEAFGLAYLEAQCAGLPVVAQRTAGVPAVVVHEQTGLLTPEGDVGAYADAIARLLGNVDERARLGAQARQNVLANHTLEAAAARLHQILASIP